jgi:hypothetical protein
MDKIDELRWFWATTALPGDVEDRGDHGGEVFEIEVL